MTFQLDSASEAFRRVASLTRDTSGMWINPIVEFTRTEIAGCAWLQLEARGKLVLETPAEHAFNSNALNRCPLFSARPDTRIRLPQGLALSRVRLRPHEIGSATDWLPEWVVPDAVGHAFAAAGLRGWATQSLLRLPEATPLPGYAQLFTNAIMPPVCLDRSTPAARAELAGEGGWRQLGCLTYESAALASLAADFLRSAENWHPANTPAWIVSCKVRECCGTRRLRGWAFRPVLEAATPLHAAHCRLWDDLCRVVGEVPQIHF